MHANKTSRKKNISIAYSPDTDDAFMIHALKERLVDWGDYEFSFTIGDIQELNDAAKNGLYDITAISVGAYPQLKEKYLLMPIGASVGDKFGPAVVTCPTAQFEFTDLSSRRIAVPGLTTTAHIAAQSLFGPFTPVPMHFMEIKNAVLSGAVDAGILIHELQMDPESEGLRKVGDLGTLWFNRHRLPLPLGANAIKRDLGDSTINGLSKIYKRSIEIGLENRVQTLNSAVQSAVARESLDLEKGDRYISMYVNENSLDFQENVLRGIDLIFKEGHAYGFFPATDVRSNLS
jgi:1,4-dihydroxy-6-naphthoate synthase